MLELLTWTAGASTREGSPLVGSDISTTNLQRTSGSKHILRPRGLWFSWPPGRGWVGSYCDLHSKKVINLGTCLCQRWYLCDKKKDRAYQFFKKLHLRRNLTLHISFLLWIWIPTLLCLSPPFFKKSYNWFRQAQICWLLIKLLDPYDLNPYLDLY